MPVRIAKALITLREFGQWQQFLSQSPATLVDRELPFTPDSVEAHLAQVLRN